MWAGLSATSASSNEAFDRQRLGAELPREARGRPRRDLVAVAGEPFEVGRGRSDGEEEGLAGARPRAQDLVGLGRDHVRLVILGGALVAHRRAFVAHRVVEQPVGRGIDQPEPARPPRRGLGGAHPVVVEVFADVGGVVAGLLEPDRQRVGVVEVRVAAMRSAVGEHAVVVGVLAGEEGRARGAAERDVDEAVGERGAPRRQQRPGLRQGAHLLDRLVVGHDHQDVGAAVRRRGACRAGLAGPPRCQRQEPQDEEEDQTQTVHGLSSPRRARRSKRACRARRRVRMSSGLIRRCPASSTRSTCSTISISSPLRNAGPTSDRSFRSAGAIRRRDSGEGRGEPVRLPGFQLEDPASVGAADQLRSEERQAVEHPQGERPHRQPPERLFEGDPVDRVEMTHPRQVGHQPRRVVIHVGEEKIRRGQQRHSPPGGAHAALVGLVDPLPLPLVDVPARRRRGPVRGRIEQMGPGSLGRHPGPVLRGERQAAQMAGARRRDGDELPGRQFQRLDRGGVQREIAVVAGDDPEVGLPPLAQLGDAGARADPGVEPGGFRGEQAVDPLLLGVLGNPASPAQGIQGGQVPGLIQLAMAGRAGALRQQQDDFGQDAGEDQPLEKDDPHLGEAPHQKLAHRGRVVHCQQLGRQDQSQPAARLEEGGGMDHERRPRAREPRQPDPLLQRDLLPLRPRLPRELLVAHIGGIADDGVEELGGIRVEEVAGPDPGLQAIARHQLRGAPGRGLMDLDPLELPLSGPCRSQGLQPLAGGDQEGGLPARRFEDLVRRGADGPFRNEVRKLRGSKEGAAGFAGFGGVDHRKCHRNQYRTSGEMRRSSFWFS